MSTSQSKFITIDHFDRSIDYVPINATNIIIQREDRVKNIAECNKLQTIAQDGSIIGKTIREIFITSNDLIHSHVLDKFYIKASAESLFVKINPSCVNPPYKEGVYIKIGYMCLYTLHSVDEPISNFIESQIALRIFGKEYLDEYIGHEISNICIPENYICISIYNSNIKRYFILHMRYKSELIDIITMKTIIDTPLIFSLYIKEIDNVKITIDGIEYDCNNAQFINAYKYLFTNNTCHTGLEHIKDFLE
jgi:hypothetical protein